MKAIFKGTLSGGMKLLAVRDDATASRLFDDYAEAFKTSGNIFAMVEVHDPSDLALRTNSVEGGRFFVVYGKGLGNGFTMYGPFGDVDSAETYAETYRGEDDEWEIFTLEEAAPAVEASAQVTLPFGITIEAKDGGTLLDSTIGQEGTLRVASDDQVDMAWGLGIASGIEALLLALACEGVNIHTQAFANAIQTAVEAAANNDCPV